MHVRKNDRVIVTAGKDKGKIGKVLRVLPETSRVVVEGINKIKRHTKPNQQNRQGGIVEKEAPLHSSNVMLVTKDGKPTRVGFKITETKREDGKTDRVKVRIARKTGEEI
jgi:large subunit ribosomal protein L24